MAQPRSAVRRTQGQDMRRRVLEFRKLGLTMEAIGEKLGCSTANVSKHLKKALEELAVQNIELAKSYQTLQLMRYEALLLPLQSKASKGDVSAISQMTRILDSITRLVGADAPAKIAPTTPDGLSPYEPLNGLRDISDEELDQRIAELEHKVNDKHS